MLVAVIPMPLHHLAGMRLILFPAGVIHDSDVLMHTEVKQWSRLATHLHSTSEPVTQALCEVGLKREGQQHESRYCNGNKHLY